MRAIKDHVEKDINKFMRGKSHTVPKEEKDIAMYTSQLAANHVHDPPTHGRKFSSSEKVTDIVQKGLDALNSGKALARWAENRVYECATGQDWSTLEEPVAQ